MLPDKYRLCQDKILKWMRGKGIERERKTRNLKAETRKGENRKYESPVKAKKTKRLAKSSPTLTAKPAEMMGHARKRSNGSRVGHPRI
jgi:hypothetical protein